MRWAYNREDPPPRAGRHLHRCGHDTDHRQAAEQHPSPGGQQPEVKVSARLVSSETLDLDLQTAVFSLCLPMVSVLCVSVSTLLFLFGLEPTRMISFTLITSAKTLCPNAVTFGGPGGESYSTEFWAETQSSP